MKTSVEIYTDALVRVLQDSREYREYEKVKEKMVNKPELMKTINKYRMDNYALQNENDEDQLYEKTERFYESTGDIRENPLMEEYLACELAVCRMLQKLFSTIVDSIDLQLDEIAKEIPFGGEKKS